MPATPEASWFQSDFRGGEVSPDAQGTFDDPMYGKSMALCRNAYVLPTGPVERRQGTRLLGHVIRGAVAVRAISLNNGAPVIVEINENSVNGNGDATGGLFFWAPPSVMGASLPGFTYDAVKSPLAPVCDEFIQVQSIDTSDPAVFTLAATPTNPWKSGDRVSLYVDDQDPSTASVLRNRVFQVDVITPTTFTVTSFNTIVPSISGSSIVNRTTFHKIYAAHHLNFAKPLIADYSPYGAPSDQPTYFTAPYDVRIVPAAGNKYYFLYPHLPPWVLDCSVPSQPTFQDANSNWWDGPWEDPPPGSSQTGNRVLTIVSNSGSEIVLNYNSDALRIPEIRGIGQSIRLWTQPALYDSGTAYTSGQVVSYNDEFYQATATSTGVVPGTADPTGVFPWVLDPTLGTWSNGFLVATNEGTGDMTFQIVSDQQVPTYDPANTIETYQAGLYFLNYDEDSAFIATHGTVFAGRGPRAGAWHEGRLWLIGADEDLTIDYSGTVHGAPTQYAFNRFDASQAGTAVTVGGSIPATSSSVPVLTVPGFSPTDPNGNVLDDSAIDYSLNSDTAETLHWAQPVAQGLLIGTNTSEWLVEASSLNDPITPTSIQAHRQTRFGSKDIPPFIAPLAVFFVQRAGKRVVEYIADVLSGRYEGQPINDRALHMSGNASISPINGGNVGAGTNWIPGGIKEIGYQEEPYPFVWVVMNDGTIASCTYRRLSRFGQEAPVLNAWHSHTLGVSGGKGMQALSVTVARSLPPDLEAIVCVSDGQLQQAILPSGDVTVFVTRQVWFNGVYTQNTANGLVGLQMMMPPYGPNGHLAHAWFLDNAVSGGIDGVVGKVDLETGQLILYGLGEFVGETLSVYALGTYQGDFTVAAGGSITIPTVEGENNWNDTWTPDGDFWQYSACRVAQYEGASYVGESFVPVVVGSKFTSQALTLRPSSQQDAKTPTGPTIGKQRRFHMIGAQVQNCVEFNLAVTTEPYIQIVNPGYTGASQIATQFDFPGTFKSVPVVLPDGSAYSGNLDFPALSSTRKLAFNGVLWSTVDDDYTFDGMIAWQVSDPYPCRVLSIGGFFQTQER